MGLPVIRLASDDTQGHNGFFPVPAAGASSNVFVNSMGVVRQGDPFNPHSAPDKPTHVGNAVGGGSVRVNGRLAQRAGDGLTCGDTSANGSSNVRFG